MRHGVGRPHLQKHLSAAPGPDCLKPCVEESGAESALSYAQLSARSSQVANFLQRQGAVKGQRVLLMLGNEVPLWEVMLAAIKLGLVVIPATTLLSGPDLVAVLTAVVVAARAIVTGHAPPPAPAPRRSFWK